MRIFRPSEILNRFDELNIESYIKRGYNTILLDVDNTITPYYVKLPTEEGKLFVKKLKKSGFRVIVFSNNTKKRVEEVAKSIDCEYVCWAFKPIPYKVLKTLKKENIDKKKVLIMGDQLMTDVIAGNLSGITSIYSKPISEVDSFTTKINRFFERKVFKYILHEKV